MPNRSYPRPHDATQDLHPNGIEQTSGVTFVLDYMPWQLALGGSYELIRDLAYTLSVAASATYSTWSSYVDRHGHKPTPSYGWSDTLTPTLGLRYSRASVHTLLDLAYAPTPVPRQTGRTNYVDNDRVSGTLGGEYHFRAWNANMRIGVQGQLHKLIKRSQIKLPTPDGPDGNDANPELVRDELPDDAQISGEPVESAYGLQTNNPGWPGFSSTGFILAGTLYFALAL